MVSPEREHTHTHTHTHAHTQPGALDTPPQSSWFNLSRCCYCCLWAGSCFQSRKPAPEDKQAEARGRPGPALRFLWEPRAPRPLLPFPLFAAVPTSAPAAQGASADRSPLPAGREWRGRGATRSLRQLLPPWPALRIVLERPPGRRQQTTQERGGNGHAVHREPPAGGERARPPPSHPARKARSLRRAGRPAAGALGLGARCSQTAPTRRGHLPSGHPRVRLRPAPHSGYATRDPLSAEAPGALLP